MNARITWSPGEARALRETAARVAVLVIGSLNIDLILTADAEPPDEGSVLVRDSSIRAGGHAGNCASALAALGVSVTLLAAVGTDADGDALLDDLRGRGVDVTGVRRDPRAATGRVVIPVFGEKHYMLCLRGANDLYTASDVRAALASGRASYDAVMMFDPSSGVLREIGRIAGALPGAPLLCWTPGGVYSRDPLAARVLPHCDVVFANRAERDALRRTAPPGPPGSPEPPAHPVPARTAVSSIGREERTEMVVTLGKEGSSLRHRGAERVVPVDPVPVVDPTGAGDAFAATYLLARLAGIEPERRLAAANLSGALAVGAVGARGRLATLGDLIGPAARAVVPASCHPAIGGTG